MSEVPLVMVASPNSNAPSTQPANSFPLRLTSEEHKRLLLLLQDGEAASMYQQSEGRERMQDGDRVTRLEVHFEYIRRDLDDLKSGQTKVLEGISGIDRSLSRLPTKTDLDTWRLQWIAICVGAIALIVGGIIGGLSWIKPDAAPIILRAEGAQKSASSIEGGSANRQAPGGVTPRP